MLAENIGFDYNEDDFAEFSAHSTLHHIVVGPTSAEGLPQFALVLDQSSKGFPTADSALEFLSLDKSKEAVCISTLSDQDPAMASLLNSSLVCNVNFLGQKITANFSKSYVLEDLKLTNCRSLFGFYEWVNIVASTTPANDQERDITQGFRAYLHGTPLKELSAGAAAVADLLRSTFQKQAEEAEQF